MSSDEEATAPKKPCSVLQDRKTFWFTLNEIKKLASCPSCGQSLDKFKNITTHVKRCFSIKKIGPIYRIHGYVECKCGLLLADNTKAQKLHVCMGEVPAFEPDLTYVRPTPKPVDQRLSLKRMSPCPQIEPEVLPQKPWIRNFVSPFKLDLENIHDNPQPKPHVHNYDMPVSHREPKNVSVYSIGSYNGSIYVKGQTSQSGNQNVILIRKRVLRLPHLKGS